MTAGYIETRAEAPYDKIHALCYGPYSKSFDEHVSIVSLKRGMAIMALFIAE